MTPKQFEHIGRAMMLTADLAQGVSNLRDTRNALADELTKLIGGEAANNYIKNIMTDYAPTVYLGERLTELANAIAESNQ